MIRRGDGGFAGGVLGISDDMQASTAPGPAGCAMSASPTSTPRPRRSRQAGGKDADAADRHPGRRPDRDGRRSAGRALLHHEAEPARPGTPRREERRVLARPAEQRVRWNELSTSDPAAASPSTAINSAGDQEDVMDMGEMGKYRFIDHQGTAHRRFMRNHARLPVSKWRYYFRVDDIAAAKATVEARGGTVSHGPAGSSRRRLDRHRHATRRARNSRSSAASKTQDKKENRNGQQDDHLPVVRQRRSPQGGRILCLAVPRHPCRQAQRRARRLPRRRAGRRADGRVHAARAARLSA